MNLCPAVGIAGDNSDMTLDLYLPKGDLTFEEMLEASLEQWQPSYNHEVTRLSIKPTH